MKQTVTGVIAAHMRTEYSRPGVALAAVCEDLRNNHGVFAYYKGRCIYVNGAAVAWVNVEWTGDMWIITKCKIR